MLTEGSTRPFKWLLVALLAYIGAGVWIYTTPYEAPENSMLEHALNAFLSTHDYAEAAYWYRQLAENSTYKEKRGNYLLDAAKAAAMAGNTALASTLLEESVAAWPAHGETYRFLALFLDDLPAPERAPLLARIAQQPDVPLARLPSLPMHNATQDADPIEEPHARPNPAQSPSNGRHLQ